MEKKGKGPIVIGRGSKELAACDGGHSLLNRKGVILKVPYQRMNGLFFEYFVRQHFNICFARCT